MLSHGMFYHVILIWSSDCEKSMTGISDSQGLDCGEIRCCIISLLEDGCCIISFMVRIIHYIEINE